MGGERVSLAEGTAGAHAETWKGMEHSRHQTESILSGARTRGGLGESSGWGSRQGRGHKAL